ncbi:MetQ/NlpA family ABC transporter substrate-binding protein [Marinisporobacter balticus]|uniref:Lipoprotein n=1 Tax=Marinisporobacter balticus TaxID=2018667 RepID=A0A4R2KL44_9FIRM|nr:MetQ/NlpA family ABC transporter substrate-binding protein [Marinisporobacter balticus]TCO71386.1 D-methionine transport system substrate-binding protein [Marinisporobacter balticus]
MKKFLFVFLSILFTFTFITGCTSKENVKDTPLKVGVTAGPHEQIVEKVKELSKEKGLDVEIVSFNDYTQPNVQVFEKQIDINSFQHTPYLSKFNEDHKMDLVNVASTVNFPMGIYSNQLKSLDELKEGDKISLPNDPTNEARALILLQSANIIKLKDSTDLNMTIADIVDNPKNIEFIELDAPMVAHSLPDVSVAAINTNYAMQAGFNPVKDSIFIESKDSPWVNIIAARPDNKDSEKVKQFIAIYQSEAIKKFIEETFDGSVVSGF